MAIYGPPVIFFVFFDTSLWVRFSVKNIKQNKKQALLSLISQAIPVDGHVCVFWTISYAIVCHHGYHTDQKHAKSTYCSDWTGIWW